MKDPVFFLSIEIDQKMQTHKKDILYETHLLEPSNLIEIHEEKKTFLRKKLPSYLTMEDIEQNRKHFISLLQQIFSQQIDNNQIFFHCSYE